MTIQIIKKIIIITINSTLTSLSHTHPRPHTAILVIDNDCEGSYLKKYNIHIKLIEFVNIDNKRSSNVSEKYNDHCTLDFSIGDTTRLILYTCEFYIFQDLICLIVIIYIVFSFRQT